MSSSILMRILAAWGLAVTAALGVKLWVEAREPNGPKAKGPDVTPSTQAPATRLSNPTEASASANNQNASATSDHEPSIQTMPRYHLCQAKRSPTISLLPSLPYAAVAVHCGDSAQILNFDRGTPQLIADLQFTPAQPQTESYPARAIDVDINGDGRPDLAIGTRRVGANNTPAGGSVYMMAASNRGGLTPPQELLFAHPLNMFVQHQNAGESASLWLVHGRNTHHGNGPELWRYRQTDAPPRTVVATFPMGSSVLALADLDLDGEPEALVSGNHDGQAGLWLWELNHAEPSDQAFFPIGPVTGIAIGDSTGDGNTDAVIAGEALWMMEAASNTAATPTKLDDSDCLNEAQREDNTCYAQPSLADLDHDGFMDVLSYANGSLVVFYGKDGKHFSPSRRLRMEGKEFVVDALRVIQQNRSDAAVLMTLVHMQDAPSNIELASLPIESWPDGDVVLRFAETTEDIAKTPLATLDRL